MILFLSVIVLAVLAGFLAGGRLGRFTQLDLRWWALAPIAFALQGVPLPDGQGGIDLAIRMLVFGTSYALVLIFALKNLRIAGVPMIVVGLVLNGLVVTLNGGMPVSRSALLDSGQGDTLRLLEDDQAAKHQLMADETVLPFLGDVIAVGDPIRQVVSVGDLFVYAGISWLIVGVMQGRTAGLVRPEEPERYRGRHRRRRAVRQVAAAPDLQPETARPATTRWGTGP